VRDVTGEIGAEYARKCIRILQALEVATTPQEMDIAGLRFHSLHGKPQRWAVRVSANYRITFGWRLDQAAEVNFEDYH
jgi:proteic killer suppression protein